MNSRRFNENDILGDLDRDEKGHLIIAEPQGANDVLKDKQSRLINKKGYLVDKEGNLINNINGKIMFT
jgi:hypothetical protein